ncbi:MAG TPA: energy transducer TonB [Candidatus Acidoferrales bacterium]
MKFGHCLLILTIAVLAMCSLSAAQAASDSERQKQDVSADRIDQLKLIRSPVAPYPDEAQKKNIEGTVNVVFEVDADGHVSGVKAASGPPELFQAAIDSVKMWEYEAPNNAPVATSAKISFGHPRECPGSVSDSAYVSVSEPLRSDRGTVVNFIDDNDQILPPYFPKDRKAGIAGEMILSITVNAHGKVTRVRVIQSLSPHLDRAAAKRVRTWNFKLIERNTGSLPDKFQLHIFYKAMCPMQV